MVLRMRVAFRKRENSEKNFSRQRKTDGVYIIEILVALIIGALFAFALGNSLSEALRISSTSTNEAYANSVVENLIECSRSIDYPQLAALKGQTFAIDDTNAVQTSFTIHQFPLLLDLTNNWDRVKFAKFQGSVTYQISEGPEVGNSLTISVSARWTDSQWHSAPRTVSRSIVRIDPSQWSI